MQSLRRFSIICVDKKSSTSIRSPLLTDLGLVLNLAEVYKEGSRLFFTDSWGFMRVSRTPIMSVDLVLAKWKLHYIWYLVLYGILCHYGNFSDDTSHQQVNKHCHGWWMSSFTGQNPTFSCQQLVMKYCHAWLIFEWKNHLVSDISCNTVTL